MEQDGKTENAERITQEELRDRMNYEDMVILDVRSDAAYDKSDLKIPGAIRVPPDEIEKHFRDLPKDKTIYTYCT